MSNAATIPIPTVTARGVSLASRALFAYLGALLAPLMAVHLFGRGAPFAAIALSAGVGAISGGLVGRIVGRPSRSRHIAAAAVLMASMLTGLAAGVLCGLAWVTVIDSHPSVRDAVPVGMLFGGLFGLAAGACFAGPFAVWTSRARGALDAPSALSAQRLTMDAGLLLAAGGAAAVSLHRLEVFVALGAGTAVAGTLLLIAAVVRTARLGRFYDAVTRGELTVAPRGDRSVVPPLVAAVPLDHVLVVPVENTAGASPFRANEPVREVAAVPADMGLVRSGLRGAVAYGVALLALVALLDVGLAVRAFGCEGGCPSSAAPCGCDH